MIEITELSDPKDLSAAQEVIGLYGSEFPIAPVVHEVMTGRGLMEMFLAYERDQVVIGEPPLVGAAVLKSPEVAVPIGAEIQPLAWVISDVMVSQKKRGQGVASVLVKHLEGEVVKRGGRIIYLYTGQQNHSAQRLYGKAGFEKLRDQGDQMVFAKLIRE